MKKEICKQISELLDVPLECITDSVFKNIVSVETSLQLHKYLKNFGTQAPLEKTTTLFELIEEYKTRYTFVNEAQHATKQKARFIPLAPKRILNEESSVIGNCIQCGKIALLDDDPNQCNFCSSPIMELGNFMDQYSDKMCLTENIALKEAQRKLDQLLEYQSTWSSHSHVYDDAVDWFRESNNIWLSEEQKEQMLSKAHMEEDIKQNRKTNSKKYVTIDLQNQKVFVTPSQDTISMETSNDFLHRIGLKNTTEISEDIVQSKMEAMGETDMSLATLPAPLSKSCEEMYNYLHSNMITNKNITAVWERKN